MFSKGLEKIAAFSPERVKGMTMRALEQRLGGEKPSTSQLVDMTKRFPWMRHARSGKSHKYGGRQLVTKDNAIEMAGEHMRNVRAWQGKRSASTAYSAKLLKEIFPKRSK